MSDHRDVATESRTLTLQAIVFRALREHGLEPELSDISAVRVAPADTLQSQMFRTLVGSTIVAHLRNTIGLDESERHWVYMVVDAACRRLERQRQPQVTSRHSITMPAQPPALVSTSTATATIVVFRRRNGDGHG